MEPTTDAQEVVQTPDGPVQVAPSDMAPPQAMKTQAVDNSMVTVTPEAAAPDPEDVPLQELPDDLLPKEIQPGAMGAERVLLMQLLGLDVNHDFDAAAEAEIARRAPEYDGVVTKAVWRELYKETPMASAAPSAG